APGAAAVGRAREVDVRGVGAGRLVDPHRVDVRGQRRAGDPHVVGVRAAFVHATLSARREAALRDVVEAVAIGVDPVAAVVDARRDRADAHVVRAEAAGPGALHARADARGARGPAVARLDQRPAAERLVDPAVAVLIEAVADLRGRADLAEARAEDPPAADLQAGAAEPDARGGRRTGRVAAADDVLVDRHVAVLIDAVAGLGRGQHLPRAHAERPVRA